MNKIHVFKLYTHIIIKIHKIKKKCSINIKAKIENNVL